MARWLSFLLYLSVSVCLVIGLAHNGRALEQTLPHQQSSLSTTQNTTQQVENANTRSVAQRLVNQRLVDQSLSALLSRGRTYYANGQFNQALEAWTLAVDAAQLLGDRLPYSLALSYTSLAHQSLGQWSLADETIRQSRVALMQFAEENSIEEPFNQQLTRQQLIISGQVFNTQGSLDFARGKLDDALEAWQQSSSFYQQADEPQRYLGSLINQARALHALGYFSQAHRTLTQAQEGLAEEPNVALKVLGFHSLGDVLYATGELTNAKDVLGQGLALAQSQGMRSEQSALLISLGQVAEAELDFDAALKHYRQAAARQSSPGESSPGQSSSGQSLPDLSPLASHSESPDQAQLQAQIGELGVLVNLENWPAAESLAVDILQQIKPLSPNRSTLYSRIRVASLLMQLPKGQGQPSAGVELLAATVQQARKSGDRYAETYALGDLGHMYEQANQWADAKALTQEALAIAQELDATDIMYQWQWQMARILKRQGNPTAALSVYKSAFESLKSLRYDLVSSSVDRQFSFKKQVEPVYREYVDLLLAPTADISPATLQQARQVIESLQLAELSNFFQSTCIEGQAIAIDRVDQTDTAVIYPIVLGDTSSQQVNQRLEVIVSLPNHPLQHHTIPVSRDEFEETVDRLRLSLTRPFPAPEGKDLGKDVYNWLIRPIETELSQTQVKTLVFVLDGSLREIPMAALFDGEHYLIENYQVALTPGLQLLNPQSLKRQRIKAIGAGLTESRHGFAALENVGLELETVDSTIPSRILINQRFTSGTLQEQIKKLPFPIVHLATHGQFSSNAEETFILAWDKPIKVGELSDILRTGDLSRETPIELLIMSACETATGDDRAVLGLAGIAVRAGVRSTLASLWSVDDESTAQLMSRLYRELADNTISKAEALRRAQLSLLQDPNYRAPVYWSPFVLLGNWL